MGAPTEESKGSENPMYDISVSVPSGGSIEMIREKAVNELGLPEEKADAIVRALNSGPNATLGRNVPKDRAEKARDDFTKIGLRVELSAVLSLRKMVATESDGRMVCPACQKRVVLPANRQCPDCNVFVDKVTEEFLLKRKLMEQERARAEAQLDRDAKQGAQRSRDELERALREKIRAEIEEEYGLSEKGKGLFSGKAGRVRVLAGLALLVGAIFAGRFSSQIPGLAGTASAQAATGKTSAPTAAAGSAASGQDPEKMIAMALEKGLPDEVMVSENGEPLDEDSLLKLARRGGGGGLSMEQAAAAAGSLAKAVGNNTLERASSTGGAGPAGSGGPSAKGPQTGGAATEIAVPKDIKITLASEFAVRLAEIDQGARAREIVKSLQSQPELASDPGVATQVRLADIQVRAWTLNGMAPGRAGQQANALKDEIAKVSDPLERTLAFARSGAILAQHVILPRDVAFGFLALGSESMKAVAPARQQQAMAEWTVAMGEALLSDLNEAARTGKWARAQELYKRLGNVISQAPNIDAAARMQGMEYRARTVMGLADRADASIEVGLLWVNKAGDLPSQVRALRGLAGKSGLAAHPKLQQAGVRLQELADASKNASRTLALSELTLLFAQGGQGVVAARARDQFLQAVNAQPSSDASALAARTLVHADLAMAQVRHGEGAYAEAETFLQRVAGYVL